MTWIDLGNPIPLPEPFKYLPIVWSEGKRISFPERSVNTSKSFSQISLQRRTRYEFGPVDFDVLGSLLTLTCRAHSMGNDRLGFALSKRPAPSAGAIHPIHVIVHMNCDNAWYRYDPVDHALVEIISLIRPTEVRAHMEQIVSGSEAVMLLFAAEPGRTFAKYADACSLIWRDAGVLLGYFAIASESLNLNFSPLGITGEPWIGELVEKGKLFGVGAAFVGSIP